jgi:thiol-disulfide isomerase/thioredoxin
MSRKGISISVLLFWSLLLCHTSYATTIKGQILPSDKGELPSRIYLRAYTQSQSFSLDSADVNAYGAYLLEKEITNHRLYYLIIGKIRYKVFLSPDESQIRIQNQYQNQEKIWIENSPENDAYTLFRQSIDYYEPSIFNILKNHIQIDSLDIYIRPLIKGLRQNLMQIEKYYPQTFIYKTLCSTKSWVKRTEVDTVSDLRKFLRQNFLSTLPFENENLLELPIFDDTYMGYVANLMDTTNADLDTLTLLIENKILPPKIYLYTHRQLFRFLILAQRENQLSSFLKQHINNPRLKDDLVLQSQMKEVVAIMPGQKAREIKGFDVFDKSQLLSSFLEKNKLTLLMFWEPDCSHCQEAMPRLETLFEKYGNKGLGIFGVSIGEDKEKWKKYLVAKKVPWTNIQMAKNEKEKNDASYFFVVYTPTFVLIKKMVPFFIDL